VNVQHLRKGLARDPRQSIPILGDHEVDSEGDGSVVFLEPCPTGMPYASIPLLDPQLADTVLGMALRRLATRVALRHLGGQGEDPAQRASEPAS
jgi:hypothetical protein